MTVSSINNVIFLKETKPEETGTRKSGERRKSGEESASNVTAESKQAQEVAEENRTAGSQPPIEDFAQARDVLKSVMDMMDRNGEKGLASHSGQAIDPSIV